MIKGFTLLELIVVIIIIGVLATLGFTQYVRMVEKGRTAEAKLLLGQIRSAEIAYNHEYGTFGAIANIYVRAPTSCTSTHYFTYRALVGTVTATATRCVSGGKTPTGPSYVVTINYNTGVWGGTAGYY